MVSPTSPKEEKKCLSSTSDKFRGKKELYEPPKKFAWKHEKKKKAARMRKTSAIQVINTRKSLERGWA